MLVTKDGVNSNGNDLCGTCCKDITECIFKKALNNYHDGGEIPVRFILLNCPEYRMVYERNDRITFEDFEAYTTTLNTNVNVRVNTEVTNSGT